jgi:cytochrome c553
MKNLLIPLLTSGAALLAVTAAQAASEAPAPEWEPSRLEQALSHVAQGKPAEGERLHHYLYCSACHGDDGNSPSRNWPSLTGQKPDYVMGTSINRV